MTDWVHNDKWKQSALVSRYTERIYSVTLWKIQVETWCDEPKLLKAMCIYSNQNKWMKKNN